MECSYSIFLFFFSPFFLVAQYGNSHMMTKYLCDAPSELTARDLKGEKQQKKKT